MTMLTKHVLLIGPRGCGKTTVAGALAQRLEGRADDLDDLVRAHFNISTVTEAWENHGEPAWRQAEGRVLADWLNRTAPGMIALGGGAPMVSAVQEAIAHARTHPPGVCVVYLACDPSELRQRLTGETADRPSLTGADPLAEIKSVLESREATYLELADVVVNVTGRPIDEVVEETLDEVG